MRVLPIITLFLVSVPCLRAQTVDSTRAAEVVPATPEVSVSGDPTTQAAAIAVPTQSLAELIAADSSLSILKQALDQSNLLGALGEAYEAGYTILAPTNEAFRKVPTLEALLGPAQTQILYRTLMYHVVPGTYLAPHFLQLEAMRSWQGADIPIVVRDEAPIVGGAHLAGEPQQATNGVLHPIDTVLTVPVE